MEANIKKRLKVGIFPTKGREGLIAAQVVIKLYSYLVYFLSLQYTDMGRPEIMTD